MTSSNWICWICLMAGAFSAPAIGADLNASAAFQRSQRASLTIQGQNLAEMRFNNSQVTFSSESESASGLKQMRLIYSRASIEHNASLSRPPGGALPQDGLFHLGAALSVHGKTYRFLVEPRLRSGTNSSRSWREIQMEAYYVHHITEPLALGLGYTTEFGRALLTPMLFLDMGPLKMMLPLEAHLSVLTSDRLSLSVVAHQTGGTFRSTEKRDFLQRETDLSIQVRHLLKRELGLTLTVGALVLRRFDVRESPGHNVHRKLGRALYGGLAVGSN